MVIAPRARGLLGALHQAFMTEISKSRVFQQCALGWAAACAATSTAAMATLLLVSPAPAWAQMSPGKPASQGATVAGRKGDYIVAVVGGELVTAAEIDRSVERLAAAAARSGQGLPPMLELRQKVLDSMIDERVLINHAKRNYNLRIDDAEVDRAVANVAAQNQLSVEQLRERLAAEGMDVKRYREQIREQMMVERVRDVEVRRSVAVSETDVDEYIARQMREAQAKAPINLAQILISVPDGAKDADVAARRAVAEQVVKRLNAGEPFEQVARAVSDDKLSAPNGGVMGLRSPDKFPDLFVRAVAPLKAGQVLEQPVRSAAGFHILKLLERNGVSPFSDTQTRARHILMRPKDEAAQASILARMQTMRRDVLSGAKSFEQLAKEFSEDGSAAQGGDLGWASPGMFVPEFEQAMNALPLKGISEPLMSRFGIHLIQVMERRTVEPEPKQLREQARNALREQRFEEANERWVKEIRSQSFIEMRESPQ